MQDNCRQASAGVTPRVVVLNHQKRDCFGRKAWVNWSGSNIWSNTHRLRGPWAHFAGLAGILPARGPAGASWSFLAALPAVAAHFKVWTVTECEGQQ